MSPRSRYGRQWAAWRPMISRSDSVRLCAKSGRGAIRRRTKVGMRRTLASGPTALQPLVAADPQQREDHDRERERQQQPGAVAVQHVPREEPRRERPGEPHHDRRADAHRVRPRQQQAAERPDEEADQRQQDQEQDQGHGAKLPRAVALDPSGRAAAGAGNSRNLRGAAARRVRRPRYGPAPMHETTPRVYLIARPSVELDGMRAYLEDVGGQAWLDRRLAEGEPNQGELLVEFGGRACYRSWEPGLNVNVTRVRSDRREYIENILRSAHGSVLEHASYSFALRNVSRVFTHELVRHRAGSAFSQESLRYVRLTDIGFRVPAALAPVRERALAIVEQLEEFQREAAAALHIDDEGVPFHIKKEVTSALRRLAPLGLSTDIIWTANLRTLRHVIEMRTDEGAEEELRSVFDEVARVMVREAPNVFQDFERDSAGCWRPRYRKV